MAKDASAEIMQALVAKLYATITGNDNNIKLPRNKFITWALPGIPFVPEDFLFCSKGLIADTAEATNERYVQAFNLAKLFDFIPDVSNQFMDATMQQTILTSTQDSISSVYNDVLKYSKVYDSPLTPVEQKKLKKFRDLITVTKEVEDIITEEKRMVTEPGPITLAYTAKMNDYIDAGDEYMNLLIDAQAAKGKDSEAIRRVAAFANKSKFMRKKLEAAYLAWVSQGYKNEYEQMNAYINQVTQKSMVLYKQDLQNKFTNGLLTAPSVGAGGDFHYTTIIPGSFATSPGWTKFYFYDQDYAAHYSKSTSQWSAGASLNFGLFSIGGGASGSNIAVNNNAKAANFSAEFEFTQVPICRPWFDPGFFSMRAWTLDNIWDLNYPEKKVSDGGITPAGRLVAYPTTALFVRNLNIRSSNWTSESQYVNNVVSGGGRVGWGPFSIGGSYSRGSEKRDSSYTANGGGVEVNGMQLVGFINNIIPKSPDLNPKIKPSQLV